MRYFSQIYDFNPLFLKVTCVHTTCMSYIGRLRIFNSFPQLSLPSSDTYSFFSRVLSYIFSIIQYIPQFILQSFFHTFKNITNIYSFSNFHYRKRDILNLISPRLFLFSIFAPTLKNLFCLFPRLMLMTN